MSRYAFTSGPSGGYNKLLVNLLVGLAAMLMLFLVGCATVGRDFPVARVSDIRIRETTQNEIRAMFGSPWRVGVESGRRTWTYGKYRYRLFGEASTQDLVIRFDERNIVVSYTFNTTEHQE